MRGYASKIASRPLDIVIIRPYFTVLDWDKARPVMAEFVRRTGTEGRMVFYGWDIDGDTLHCREGYRDGDAAVRAQSPSICVAVSLSGAGKVTCNSYQSCAAVMAL